MLAGWISSSDQPMSPVISARQALSKSSARAPGWALVAAFGFLAFAVVAFSRAWIDGGVVLDGAGVALYARLGLDHLRAGGLPYWLPEMWAGSPAWALAPSFPVYVLVPFAAAFGPETAVKVVTLGTQIIGAWGTFVLARSLWPDAAALRQRGADGPQDAGSGDVETGSGGREIEVGGWVPGVVVATLAGLLYGLHPLFISHGALFGHETSVWVMAATPWLAWSFRLALRGGGPAYVGLAGLVAAFAVLQQAEHAYSLVVLCACMMAVEVARARRLGSGSSGAGAVVLRAGVAAGVGLALVAHWMVPLVSLADSFVFTPAESVRAVLTDGIGGALGRHPDAWLGRPQPLSGVVTFEEITKAFDRLDGVGSGGFYLSWVLVAVSVVSLVLLGRRDDDDGHLSAIFFASAIGIWMSSGGVALASSELAQRGQFLPFAVLGLVVGVLVGGFLRRLRLGRATVVVGALSAVVLINVPYLTPFLSLQKVVPFLGSIRFPRFYPVAMLGLALGAAYPLTLVRTWTLRRAPAAAPALVTAGCLILAGLFVVDIDAYRSYYRLRPPASSDAADRAAATLAAEGDDFRVAVGSFGDPRLVESLLVRGQQLSVGWPHPLAGKDLWTLTGAAVASLAPGYRQAALGLSSTAFLAWEESDRANQERKEAEESKESEAAGSPTGGAPANLSAAGPAAIDGLGPPTSDIEDGSVSLAPRASQPAELRVDRIVLERNPKFVPLVRAYRQAVVVEDPDLATGMAVALAPRYIGVVTGAGEEARALGPSAAAAIGGETPCGEAGPRLSGRAADQSLPAEVAMACALSRWVDTEEGRRLADLAERPGAIFRSPVGGLAGLSVLLEGSSEGVELVLRQVGADGRSLGDEVLRTTATGRDHNGLVAFPFDPIATSAGASYAFSLSCNGCEGEPRRLGQVEAAAGDGNLVVDGAIDRSRSATFALMYDRVPPAQVSQTRITADRGGPGRWAIRTQGADPSLLVVAEAFFPGWQATVDGRPAPVLKADGAFLGVFLPAGEHEVALVYEKPTSVVLGRALTVAGLVISLILLCAPLAARRRRTPRERR
ncbi:MAG: hypothetical protein ACT4OS_03335 [Acidimicrobiales bacterium]